MLGYLYCGILLPKENWSELIPDIEIFKLDSPWDLKDAKIDAPKMKKITLRQFVRRIRNSLGHGNVIFHVPEKITDRNQKWAETTLEFSDINPRDSSDTFHAIISLDSLLKMVKQIHGIVYTNVKERLK
ncbi:MAG TPA: HEPN family nuclease [Thermodesulfobacteriota bacterium]|nr:HEPN family nuclease [Thermodesulfobacteriota bacterium]